MSWRVAMSSVAVCLAMIAHAFAADSCGFLNLEEEVPNDGDMFVRSQQGWMKFGSAINLSLRARSKVEFAYVVRPNLSRDRAGVLVIKTNRAATTADNPALTDRIGLVRPRIPADPSCKRSRDFPNGRVWVSTRAYEDYHDSSASDTKALREYGDTIRSFHFEYWSDRKRRCTRTDDDSYDDFPGNLNSNRAQFSFNPNIVASGSCTWFRPCFWSPPQSHFLGGADHRTEMAKYTTQGGIACVRFSLSLDSGLYTFRINDLEGRELPPSKRRTPEKQYPVR
jgi:hypothetical protein